MISETEKTGRELPYIYIVDSSVDITGAFICARNAARLLVGYADIIIVLPKGSHINQDQFEDFAKVIYLPIINIRKSFFSILAYFPALFFSSWLLTRYMKRDGCDRLQINDFYLMHGVVARLFGFRGVIATWVRMDPTRFGMLSCIWLWLGYRFSDNIITVSRFIQDLLPETPKKKLVYDPVFIRNATEIASQSSRPNPETQNLVYISNYIAGKGHQYAIEVFNELANDHPNLHLYFYGSDMGLEKNRLYRQRLQEQASETRIEDRIHFHGFVSDLSKVFRFAYMALNFSESESFSLSCLEASYYGVPVIATKSGGPEEIVIDGETGFLVANNDIDAMKRAIEHLVQDKDLAKRMGSQGAEHIKKTFSSEKFLHNVREIYQV